MIKMPRCKAAVIVVMMLLVFSSAVADDRTDEVDKLFSQWDKPGSPGCALAIVQDGRIIYKKGYGLANLENDVPITPESVFYIGSVSKQFVSFCIALLVQEGKLSLDDDIREYVPEMPDYGTPITVRHLIHHTSGLRDYLELEGIAGIPMGRYHEQDVIELLARQKELNFQPGEQYLYSNSGYFLLAVIVKKASGKSLRRYAEEKIFKPLGMKNSHFHDDYRRLIKNRASGYFPAGKEKFRNFITTFDCVGSGGLYTSVEDIYLWDQNFYHHKVGGQEVFDLMHTPGTLNSGKRIDYAFGLSVGDYRGLKTVSHGGALGGYRSAILRFPEQRFSVICLFNLSLVVPMGLARKVADIFLDGQFRDKPESEVKPADKPQFIKLSERKLKEKVGAYIDRKTINVRNVLFENGRLVLKSSGRKFSLAAVSESEFFLVDTPYEVTIKFEKQGKGKPMLLHIYEEDDPPVTCEAFEPIDLSIEQLKVFEGDYHSEELQVSFRIALEKGKLRFSHKNVPVFPLRLVVQDKFTCGRYKIHFTRDDEKEIAGFRLDAGRVKNLRFVKES